MRTADLRARYAQLHGEPSRSNHRDHLIKRIIWRIQALDEGDLEQRVARIRTRAAELARDADLRSRPPGVHVPATPSEPTPPPSGGGGGKQSDARLPMPGTVLSRRYRGRTVQVRVLDRGFEYQGQWFASLSAVAKAITGSHWNGWLFFGLNSGGKARR